MIKGLIQEEDFIFVNIYAPILTDIKGETDGNTKIAGHFNTPFTSINRFLGRKSIRQQRS